MDNRILIIMVLIFMEQIFATLKFMTDGEGFIDITNDLNLFIKENDFHSGIFNLTLLHTSCRLNCKPNQRDNL